MQACLSYNFISRVDCKINFIHCKLISINAVRHRWYYFNDRVIRKFPVNALTIEYLQATVTIQNYNWTFSIESVLINIIINLEDMIKSMCTYTLHFLFNSLTRKILHMYTRIHVQML